MCCLLVGLLYRHFPPQLFRPKSFYSLHYFVVVIRDASRDLDKTKKTHVGYFYLYRKYSSACPFIIPPLQKNRSFPEYFNENFRLSLCDAKLYALFSKSFLSVGSHKLTEKLWVSWSIPSLRYRWQTNSSFDSHNVSAHAGLHLKVRHQHYGARVPIWVDECHQTLQKKNRKRRQTSAAPTINTISCSVIYERLAWFRGSH